MGTPPAVITTYCAEHGLTNLVALAGGVSGAAVYLTSRSDGTRVVVKVDVARPDLIRSDAAWLARHPHAPRVLDLDEAIGVLALEHIDGHLFADAPPVFHPQREAAWLQAAITASGPSHPNEDILVDRYRRAYDHTRQHHSASRLPIVELDRWFTWATNLDRSSWGSVALDVIFKNTIVDRAGRWWAIDPLCATAPTDVVWCPWVMDRAATAIRAGVSVTEAIEHQEELLELAPHPDRSRDWMVGATLWTLWWAQGDEDIRTAHLPARPDPAELGRYYHLTDYWAHSWVSRHPNTT